ncbi:MAG: helix-turn-helix transcriptional regulator [Polyangiaceae bacterium]
MESRSFAPPERLARWVGSLWTTRWDLRAEASHPTEILSDPCVTVAFEAASSRVVGVSTGLFRRELSGQGHIRALKLRPGAVRALIDVPAVSLTGRVVPFRQVFEGAPVGLEDAVVGAADDDAALDLIVSWLERTMPVRDDADLRLAIALVDHAAKHPEIVTVERLVAAAGVSVRPLQRLFREFVGGTPKWVIRRLRLQEAAARIERGDRTLTEVAAELGYADQAHLSRDFRAATGRSPRAFATLD